MIVLGSFLKPSYYIHSLTEVISRNFLKILHRNPRDKKMWISPLWRVESISQKFLRFSLPKGFFSWNRHIIIFFVKSTFSVLFSKDVTRSRRWFDGKILRATRFIVHFYIIGSNFLGLQYDLVTYLLVNALTSRNFWWEKISVISTLNLVLYIYLGG